MVLLNLVCNWSASTRLDICFRCRNEFFYWTNYHIRFYENIQSPGRCRGRGFSNRKSPRVSTYGSPGFTTPLSMRLCCSCTTTCDENSVFKPALRMVGRLDVECTRPIRSAAALSLRFGAIPADHLDKWRWHIAERADDRCIVVTIVSAFRDDSSIPCGVSVLPILAGSDSSTDDPLFAGLSVPVPDRKRLDKTAPVWHWPSECHH